MHICQQDLPGKTNDPCSQPLFHLLPRPRPLATTSAALAKKRLRRLPLMHTTISPWTLLLPVSRGGLVPIQIALATTAKLSPLAVTDQTSHSPTGRQLQTHAGESSVACTSRV